MENLRATAAGRQTERKFPDLEADGTNALVYLYTKETLLAKFALRSLLRLGNRIKPAKKLIRDQLTVIKAA